MPGARAPRGRDDDAEPGDMRGGQPGTRSGNSARSRLEQVVELLGHLVAKYMLAVVLQVRMGR